MRLKFSTPALALSFLPVLLSACMTAPTATAPEPASAPLVGHCNAEPAQFALGRIADAALELEARTRAGAKTARVLQPNQPVTMEFNHERLNLSVDQTGRVTRVNCG